MNVADAFGSTIAYRGDEVATVCGYLVVTESLSYLAESEQGEGHPNGMAIQVLWPNLAEALLEAGAAIRVGTMVLFAGKAEVTGALTRTGMGLMPIALRSIQAVRYWHGNEQFKIEAT